MKEGVIKRMDVVVCFVSWSLFFCPFRLRQVVILVVMGFYQVRHLKKFFKSKRLV